MTSSCCIFSFIRYFSTTVEMAQQFNITNSIISSRRPNIFIIFIIIYFAIDSTLSQYETTYHYAGCFTEDANLLRESVDAKTPQNCVELCDVKNFNYALLATEKCSCSNNITLTMRQDDELCNISCSGNKLEYCGGIGLNSYYTTRWALNAAPKHLHLINASENSLTLAWDIYQPLNLFLTSLTVTTITNYRIKSELTKTYSSLPLFQPPEFLIQNTQTEIEITDLYPATEYNISVESICEGSKKKCGISYLLASTLIGEPSPIPAQPIILKTTDTTITIQIDSIRNDNGPINKILIIVERLDDTISQAFDAKLLGTLHEAEDNGLPYYIAAELDYINGSRKFTVGDGKLYGRYKNSPLDTKTSHIHISLGVVSTLNGITRTLFTRGTHDQHALSIKNFSYSTFAPGRESLTALTVSCSVFGICFILAIITYFYLRYKTCQLRALRGNSHEMTMHQPIIERENNGFVVEDELPTTESFKEQLNSILESLHNSKRLPRNNLRLNVNDMIAEGNYGEVITGKLLQTSSQSEGGADCQLHVLALNDLSSIDQAKLIREFRNISKLGQHANILDFYGVSASSDYLYVIFEHQSVILKRRLIESRRAPSSFRITTLSEQLVLQWIYEMASAMEYLEKLKVVHKRLCSHNIYVTDESTLKLSVFGPVPYTANQKKIDITRWSAPEVLRYQRHSPKSDVWSFGIVAWECCTLGGTPYSQLNNSKQLLDALQSGSRPARPSFIFHDLYQMLLNCWTLEPSERTTFEDLTYNVRQLMTSARHALCFDRQQEQQDNNVLDTLPFYMPLLEVEA
uniref:Protein kinase domain-containing protein n=1 Tax=Glossina palpalis gambiensis TaxID=67801 RepID=A0A1B0BEZ6_9MUSC